MQTFNMYCLSTYNCFPAIANRLLDPPSNYCVTEYVTIHCSDTSNIVPLIHSAVYACKNIVSKYECGTEVIFTEINETQFVSDS